jgi:hypothetical protein
MATFAAKAHNTLVPVDSHRRRLFFNTCMTPMAAIPEGRLIWHTTSPHESLEQTVQGDLYTPTHGIPLVTHAQERSDGRQLLKCSQSISFWKYFTTIDWLRWLGGVRSNDLALASFVAMAVAPPCVRPQEMAVCYQIELPLCPTYLSHPTNELLPVRLDLFFSVVYCILT